MTTYLNVIPPNIQILIASYIDNPSKLNLIQNLNPYLFGLNSTWRHMLILRYPEIRNVKFGYGMTSEDYDWRTLYLNVLDYLITYDSSYSPVGNSILQTNIWHNDVITMFHTLIGKLEFYELL